MPYLEEMFVSDIVWKWIDKNDTYDDVGGEVKVGQDVNYGIIDIVAKTIDGKYHGFEVKNDKLSPEQVNRYIKSGYLDKVFHCSRIGGEILQQIEKNPKVEGATYTCAQIRKRVSNAIAAGQYTVSDYKKAIKESLPSSVLQQKAQVSQSVDKALDDSEKTVWKRLTRNLGIPTAGFEPSNTYISLDRAISKINNLLIKPDKIGIIDVKLLYKGNISSLDQPDIAKKTLLNRLDKSFSKEKWKELEVIKDAQKLDRHSSPNLSHFDESWVRHYTWNAFGTISEALLPSDVDNSIYAIDIMGIEGAQSPAEVYNRGENAKLIGIEAKGKKALEGGKKRLESIRDQLNRYRQSGSLTHLYLAVPLQEKERGKRVIRSKPLDDLGLITVSRTGKVNVERKSSRAEMRHDSYVKISGRHEYQRCIGFGSIRPLEEPEHVSPCRIE